VPIHGKIESLDDAIRWIYEHDGRIDTLWEAQLKVNEQNTKRLDAITKRLTACEKRIVWLCAGAAGSGAALPQIVQWLISL